ncbi:MAG: hypothetical protein LQ342_001355 [Letrouitia transgressa]|nr:MAG: hypothetical protein LQ342_001355 [Letrouitia transgressa]
MTSEFSAEATHFRGKTLTPESPVPLHIPEPSHIPVLQNQIDPIFNLMSTHMDHPSDPRSIMGSGLDTSAHPAAPIASAANTNHTETANKRASNDLQSDQGDKDYVMAFENEDLAEEQNTDIFPNHSSSSADQLSAPIPAYETFLPSTHNNHPTQSSTQSQEKLQRSPPTSSSSHQPSQDAHRTHNLSTARNFQSTDDGDDQTQESGINYQALLDNLSPSTATALSAETITSITATAPSAASNTPRPSSAEPPISALPLPAGLPPRPPPQEKPAIHPNYTTEEDIRSYHYPHVPNATSHTANTPQSNNAYRPPQGYTRPPPPNTSVGSNGLPPPPVATFQQSIQQTSPAQPSPTTPQSRQADDNAKKNTKIAASAESAEGEVSWTPEIEKMYADFLNEEAVYVAEGLWDRFPPGSRLFVGMFITNLIHNEICDWFMLIVD